MQLTKQITDETLFVELRELGQQLSRNPLNYSGLREFALYLKESLKSNKLNKYAAPAYMLYLAFLDVLNNTVEDNYIKQDVRKYIGNYISNEFLQMKSPKDIRKTVMEICQKFACILSQRNVEVNPIIEEVVYNDLSLKVRLSKEKFGFFAPAAYLRTPYLIVLDDLLTNPNYFKGVVRAFCDLIEKVNVQKLCFIEKDFGPSGTLLMATHISSLTNLPFMIYRQRRWFTGSALTGCLEKITPGTDKVCIVYDLCVTGGALREAATFIENNLKDTKVSDAVVFYDFNRKGVKERLKEKGIQLRSILSCREINENFLKSYVNNHIRDVFQNIKAKFEERKISYDEFLTESLKIVLEHFMISKRFLE